MFKRSKYSTFLTVLLVVLIIGIIAVISILIIKDYKNRKKQKELATVAEFAVNNSNTITTEDAELENLINSISSSNTGSSKKKYYNGFVMIGYIEIPKTNLKCPILEKVSTQALENGVAVLYPSNPILNTKGNIVIQGHNYRNGLFFSKNEKLEIGDKVKITDTSGTTMVYNIYEIFETTPEDTEYITRNRGENIEISLSTCTDDSKARLVILAKV